MKKFKKILVAISLSSLHVYACAGAVSGPLVVFVDFSKSQAIKKIFDSESQAGMVKCADPTTELYFDHRPTGMNEKLVREGIVGKNKAAIRKLDRMLKTGDVNAKHGYDGIVVFVEEPKPKFVTLVTGASPPIETKVKKMTDFSGVIESLCEALPPITRKP